MVYLVTCDFQIYTCVGWNMCGLSHVLSGTCVHWYNMCQLSHVLAGTCVHWYNMCQLSHVLAGICVHWYNTITCVGSRLSHALAGTCVSWYANTCVKVEITCDYLILYKPYVVALRASVCGGRWERQEGPICKIEHRTGRLYYYY